MLFLPVYNSYDFPNVQECDDINLWEDYTALHNRIVSGKEKGKYLSYNCASQCFCGGWGNRLGGISMVLTLAVIMKSNFNQNATSFKH